MFLSVVSAAAVIVAGMGQLSTEEQAAWRQIEPRIARFDRGGIAVLIDSNGWFLAHQSALPMGTRGFAKTSGGLVLELSPVSTDDVTQLVLLKASSGFVPNGTLSPAKVAGQSSMNQFKLAKGGSTPLVAVGSMGVFRAELAETQRLGVTGPARRGVTLSELRFESPAQSIGGALAFTLDGNLVGVLTAIMDSEVAQKSLVTGQVPVANLSANQQQSNAAPSASGMQSRESSQRMNFGPQGLRVAYSVSPNILKRVVDGFLSPSHQVKHPALGLQCRDVAGGAEVRVIQKGAPAEKAQLLVGDVITAMNGTPIGSAADYTRFILNTRVGETIDIKVRRGADSLTLSAVVGS